MPKRFKYKDYIDTICDRFNGKIKALEFCNYANDKIKWSCEKHGTFTSTPYTMSRVKYGCPKCAKNQTAKKLKKTNEEFIKDAKEIHNDKYNYSKVDYKNNKTKVTITCKEHGDFYVNPQDHLRGVNCGKCHHIGLSNNEWFNILKEKGSVYDYIDITQDKRIVFKCQKHGVVDQPLSAHMSKVNCPNCGNDKKAGFSKSRFLKSSEESNTSIFYIISAHNENESFIKIGITTKGVEKRFKQLPYKYNIISEYKGTADEVWKLEKDFHRSNKNNKYTPKIKFEGRTECFKTAL